MYTDILHTNFKFGNIISERLEKLKIYSKIPNQWRRGIGWQNKRGNQVLWKCNRILNFLFLYFFGGNGSK